MLSREQMNDVLNCNRLKCVNCSVLVECGKYGSTRKMAATIALELMDQIEAQQKVIEQLEKFKQDSLGLIQRHEKLKERNAAYREALEEIKDIELDKDFQSSAWTIANNALSSEPVNYHNPNDIEVLEKARDIIEDLMETSNSQAGQMIGEKVINEIEAILEVVSNG